MVYENIIQALIYIHAAAGGIALISGPISFLTKKGGKWHRIAGKLFFYTMCIVALLALIIAVSPNHENLFLFCIGIFSGYLTCSGYRVLYLKSLSRNGKAQIIDWLLTGTMFVFGLIMLGYGTIVILKGQDMGIVLIVFSMLALILSIVDIRLYIYKTNDKTFWLFNHIGKMNGAVIAAFTAFIVVNEVLPGIVGWLLPGVLGAFVGTYFSSKYKKLIKKKGKDPHEVATVKIN